MAGIEKNNHNVSEVVNSDDRHISDSSYVLNPAEFIDIHGCSRGTPVATSDTDTFLHHRTHTIPRDPCLHVEDAIHQNKMPCTLNSKDLSIPVQETNDENSSTSFPSNCDRKYENWNVQEDDKSDDDSYESAEEGKAFEEETDSDEDFVPVSEDENAITLEKVGNDFQSMNLGNSSDKNFHFHDDDNNMDLHECSGDDEEEEKQTEEQKVALEMKARKQAEELLSQEEKEDRKDKAQVLKNDGNTFFRESDYDEAISAYTKALELCPLEFHKERSIMLANRAACKMKQESYDGAIKDSTEALELHPHYIKAMLRRAELYEKTEKLDEALKDYQKVVELDPTQHGARAACMRLADQIKDRNEKMKEEMMGKLKDLGNMVLRPFGLSVNNFNLQQDPNTGSYSVQFQQNPSGNGK